MYLLNTNKEERKKERERERIYCSNTMHPMFIFKKFRYLIVQTLNNFINTFFP